MLTETIRIQGRGARDEPHGRERLDDEVS